MTNLRIKARQSEEEDMFVNSDLGQNTINQCNSKREGKEKGRVRLRYRMSQDAILQDDGIY